MLRILFTADLQLGKAFGRIPGDAGAALRAERLAVLDRIGAVARQRAVEFVAVAGDIFEAPDVDDKVLVQACEKFGAFGVPVLLLPGNHDYADGVDAVWRRRALQRALPKSVQILREPLPVVLCEGRALILPAPLARRKQRGDPTAHITAELGRGLAPDALRIGLAHGSITSFDGRDPKEAPNCINPARAKLAALDFLALGDWHGVLKVDERTWYTGTPERDSFSTSDAGSVLVVELDGPGAVPRVEVVQVGRYSWVQREIVVHDAPEVDAIADIIKQLVPSAEHLLRLHINGTLPIAQRERLHAILEHARSALCFLDVDDANLLARAEPTDFDRLPREGFVGSALDQLRETAASGGAAAADAARALQLLYRLHIGAEASC